MTPARLITLLLVVVTGCTVTDEPPNDTVPSVQPPPVARSSAAPSLPPEVDLNVTGWWAWALLDRRTGEVRGSANRATEATSTESMVKPWLAADYLAALQRRGRDPTTSELATLRDAIRVSDDAAAEQLYRSLGGDATIRRMIATCGLTGTRPYPERWALTRITAYDAARLGACLAGGRVLDRKWTAWLLREMRSVAPPGAFGIREAFPRGVAEQIAVKNGWTARSDTGQWHVACLGVWDRWSLAVLTRYPTRLGLHHGAAICRNVTRQLFI